MSTMIPPVISPDNPSEGERELFRRLRDDPATADWIVLHSLGLARHEQRVAGEIDFVVIIPGKGVLCLEVKGCSTANLRREGGLWFYSTTDRGTPISPFRQASDGMYSLQNQLIAAHPEMRGIVFGFGVVFPFARLHEQCVEWEDWQYINSEAIRSAPISRLLVRLSDHWAAHLLAKSTSHHLVPGSPNRAQCEAIRDALRFSFEIPVDPRARTVALDVELRRYTEEQLAALDAMGDNPRTIFAGPAGTGKTLLAIEASRRGRAAEHRVLFLCYNRPLGLWLQEKTVDLAPQVTTSWLHRWMMAVSGLGRAPDDVTQDFWENRLPAMACERLLETCGDSDQGYVFDELVVDEAQDILRDSYLDFLDLSLRGGLGAGTWRIFGDFANVALYESANMPLRTFRSQRSGQAPIFSLRVNCRNTPLTTEWVQLLSELDPPYSRVLRPDDGVQPAFRFYGDEDEQRGLLVAALSELRGQGFRNEDIVVLSARRSQESVASQVQMAPWKDRLRPLGQGQGGYIRYSSIKAYKGLESPAVVVTDIETMGTPEARSMFYVALTRALQRVVILANQRVRDQAFNILRTLAERRNNPV